jgi:hypothetical protein
MNREEKVSVTNREEKVSVTNREEKVMVPNPLRLFARSKGISISIGEKKREGMFFKLNNKAKKAREKKEASSMIIKPVRASSSHLPERRRRRDGLAQHSIAPNTALQLIHEAR